MLTDSELDVLQTALQDTVSVVQRQQAEIAALHKAVIVLGDKLLESIADTKITKIVASVLLREVSGPDQAKLDRLVAQSVARAELDAGTLSGPLRSTVLKSIDEMVSLVEAGDRMEI